MILDEAKTKVIAAITAAKAEEMGELLNTLYLIQTCEDLNIKLLERANDLPQAEEA